MKTERPHLRSALASLLAQGALVIGASAQGLPAAPPLPPPRPAMPGDTPRVRPEATVDEAPVLAPRRTEQPAAPAAANEANGVSPMSVDRATRRACAIEWERMKESGAAGAMVWREFLAVCAKGRSDP